MIEICVGYYRHRGKKYITQFKRGDNGRFLSRSYLKPFFKLRCLFVGECWAEHDNQRKQYEHTSKGEK